MNNLIKTKIVSKFLLSILLTAVTFFAVLFLSSCNANSATKANDTHQVTDSWGRSVNVPNNVAKISTVGSATRYVVYAQAADKLVSATDMDKQSAGRPYTLAITDTVARIPSTNNGNHINSTNVNKEEILNCNPDVIISSRTKEECDTLQNDLKIPVVGIYTQDKIFNENVYKAIDITGQVAGTKSITDKKINDLKNIENDIKSRACGLDKTIYRGAVNFKGSKNLCGTVSDYCIFDTLKLNNVAHRDDITGAYETNLEQILSWNPDYIFMDCTNDKLITEQIKNNKDAFSKLSAFNNENTYFVAPINNNGTNLEYGICEMYFMGKILYPDNFKDINIEEKFDEVFTLLDGCNLYQHLKEKGITYSAKKY